MGQQVHQHVSLEPVEGVAIRDRAGGAHTTSAHRCCSATGTPKWMSAPQRHRDGLQPVAGHVPAGPVDHLPDQVAEDVGVVHQPLARHRPRLGRRDRRRHPVPVEQVFVGEVLPDRRHPGAVREDVLERGGGLAALRELGPDVRDRPVELEPALGDELQRQHREDRLAGGVDVHERVRLPGPGPIGIGPPADQVDHHLAIDDHAHAGPDLAVLGEVRGERLPAPVRTQGRSTHRSGCSRPGRSSTGTRT